VYIFGSEDGKGHGDRVEITKESPSIRGNPFVSLKFVTRQRDTAKDQFEKG